MLKHRRKFYFKEAPKEKKIFLFIFKKTENKTVFWQLK